MMRQAHEVSAVHASTARKVVVLGTGGTIAGVAVAGDDAVYQAAQLSVAQLLAAVPQLLVNELEAYQVAQVDSKDMGWAVWKPLLQAVQTHLDREDVSAIVITHGTDTLEETALLLHLLLPASKPVVLTAAMRPATSLQADGPRNLLDAVRVAQWCAQERRPTVVAVMAGHVWAAGDVRKSHSWQIDAFDGGGAAPLGLVQGDQVTSHERPWPQPCHWASGPWPAALPRVALLTSHADVHADDIAVYLRPSTCTGEDGSASALAGLLVACTGNGTVHEALVSGLVRASAQGVAVWLSSRVARGGVKSTTTAWPSVARLTASQARLALSLALQWRPTAVLQPDECLLAISPTA